MIRFGNRAARPLRGRAIPGLWNPIETRKALLICAANHRFTTLGVLSSHSARLLRIARTDGEHFGLAFLQYHRIRARLAFGSPDEELVFPGIERQRA